MMKMVKQVKIKADQKSFNRDAANSVNVRMGDGDGTVVFPLSSEEPYSRWYWEHGELDEILSHDAKAVDLSFLNSGHAPLLDSHRSHNGLAFQIGVVRRAWLEDQRVYVEVAFSNRSEAQEVYQDVMAGIISNVSVGYEIEAYEVDEKAGTYTAIRWKPKEASFVPIPADTTVGMGRSDAERKGITMSKTAKLPGMGDDAPTEEERAEAIESEINEISALASTHNISDIGRSYIKGALDAGQTPSLAYFRGIARANIADGKPLINTDVGLTDKERQSFSLTNIARHYDGEGGTQDHAAFELEVSAAAREQQAKAGISDHGGFIIPTDVLRNYSDFTVDGINSRDARKAYGQRAPISTTSNPNIQTTDHLAGSFIENLRNVTAVLQAGMIMMDGLDNNVDIPGADQNAQTFWLSAEDDEVEETTLTQRIVSMSPKDVGAFIHFTRRMLQQSTVAIENMARMDLLIAHSLGIDWAALYGDGAVGKPTGILNTTGIGSVTFGSAIPTRGEIIDLRTSIASTNRGRGVQYLGNSIMVGDLQKTDVQPGSPTGQFLMNNDADRLVGNGYRESNQIADGDLVCGSFGDAILGMWGGLQLDRSTEQRFLRAGVTLRSIQTVDVAVRRVGSFALGNDGV